MEGIVHDSAMEKEIIGILILYKNAFDDSADILSEELFYEHLHQVLYKSIKAMHLAGDEVNVNTLNSYFLKNPAKKEGVDISIGEIITCCQTVSTDWGFSTYCTRLKDLWQRRKMLDIGQRLVTVGFSEVGDTEEIRKEAEEAIKSLDDSPNTNIISVSGALAKVNEIVEANLNGSRENGLLTGFSFLDNRGGFQFCDLIVVGAEMSSGKTSLALDLATNIANNGNPVAFYSAEMMSHQLAARMICRDSGLSYMHLMQDGLSQEELSIFDQAIGKNEKLPIYFDDSSSMSLDRIVSSIRTMVRKKKVKMAVLDYLQVIQNNEKRQNGTEEQFFGYAARKFKNLAKELNIVIILLSQLARDNDNHEPELRRIRGSGQIAEAADMVLLIYRPELYNRKYSGSHGRINPKGTALIKMAKGRNVGVGDFIVGFDERKMHFFELQSIPYLSQKQEDKNEDRPF